MIEGRCAKTMHPPECSGDTTPCVKEDTVMAKAAKKAVKKKAAKKATKKVAKKAKKKA